MKYDVDFIVEEFADRLAYMIEERNLTVGEFAKLVGTDYYSVWAWTQNVAKPTLRNLLRILNALDMTLDEFVGLEV